jgi:hypothetical protein
MDTMQVYLYRCANAVCADVAARGTMKPKGSFAATARDGNAVLLVYLPHEAGAEALLNHIVR